MPDAREAVECRVSAVAKCSCVNVMLKIKRILLECGDGGLDDGDSADLVDIGLLKVFCAKFININNILKY